MSDATTDEIIESFTQQVERQIRLCTGIGKPKMIEIFKKLIGDETPTEEWISVVKAKRAADFLRSLNERYELSQSDQNTIVDIYGELMASAPGEINWDHIGSSGTGKVDDDGSYWYTDTEFPGMKIRLNGIREFIIDSDFNLSKIQLEKLLKGIGYWCLHQINSK
jgi:hypothetical protein